MKKSYEKTIKLDYLHITILFTIEFRKTCYFPKPVSNIVRDID